MHTDFFNFKAISRACKYHFGGTRGQIYTWYVIWWYDPTQKEPTQRVFSGAAQLQSQQARVMWN